MILWNVTECADSLLPSYVLCLIVQIRWSYVSPEKVTVQPAKTWLLPLVRPAEHHGLFKQDVPWLKHLNVQQARACSDDQTVAGLWTNAGIVVPRRRTGYLHRLDEAQLTNQTVMTDLVSELWLMSDKIPFQEFCSRCMLAQRGYRMTCETPSRSHFADQMKHR